MGILLNVFGGIKPALDAHLLPQQLGQKAQGCRATNGVISPYRKALKVVTPTKAGTKISMYRINYLSVDYWLHWITDVDVVKSQLANDAFNRYYYTGDSEPKVTNDVNATQGIGTNYPLASFTLGVPVPTAPTIGTITGGVAVNQTRAYVYTLVSLWGEEGAPSAPVLGTGKSDATWNVNLPQVTQPGGGTFQIATKNLYRTVTGTDGTSSFLLVASGITLATASFADAALDVTLIGGTVLPSTTWSMPPSGMQGLIALPNGSMAGFVNNQLCISEPFQPHAWPIGNRYSVDFPIVGMAANGSSIAVCTTANPYVFTGSNPSAMAPNKARVPEPCLSKRSVVDVGWGVMYASPNGLANALSDTAEIVTSSTVLAKNWKPTFFPDTIFAAIYQGLYHGFNKFILNGVQTGAGLVTDRAGDFGLRQLTDFATGRWLDPTTGLLYLIVNGDIVQFDSDPNNNVGFDWKSKILLEKKPLNYGAIRVDADYPAMQAGAAQQAVLAQNQATNATILSTNKEGGQIGRDAYGEITFAGSRLVGSPLTLATRFVNVNVYADGKLRYGRSFTDRNVHKMTSGYKSDMYEIEVFGNVDVFSVQLGENAKAMDQQ